LDNTTRLIISPTHYSVKGTRPKFDETLQLTFTTLLTIMNEMIATAPAEVNPVALKEYLYDQVNMAMSNFLHIFAPEIEMRPDLTVDAIIEAENKIIAEKVAAMQPAQLAQPEDTPAGYEQLAIEDAHV
jgi:hypothetical protein